MLINAYLTCFSHYTFSITLHTAKILVVVFGLGDTRNVSSGKDAQQGLGRTAFKSENETMKAMINLIYI